MSFAARLIFLLFAIALLFPQSVLAHKVKLFARNDGDKIVGYAYYPGGGRYQNSPIEVYGPAGSLLTKVTTDQDGNFSYLPKSDGAHLFVISTPDGHRAEFTLAGASPAAAAKPVTPAAAVAAATAPQPADEAAIRRAVAREIAPVLERLENYEEKIRLRDIIGGIGYIMGIFGLLAFLKARKKR